MTVIDFIIFGFYMIGILSIGFYYFRKNENREDYYIGGRSIKAHHIGLSIVATDVGGGFSIGLGGVGFLMGLSGSWLLFTGLIGAWLTAVFIIPRIKKVDNTHSMLTYPDFLRHRFNDRVALAAAIISGIGYMGFTGAQVLAGAKLASATMISSAPWGMEPLEFALYLIAIITIVYTVAGGLKAVIYTDTFQWIILLGGLLLVTVPITIVELGGFSGITEHLPSRFFSLDNINSVTFINWMVTIIPIWLIGMTLYQRMYACKTEKEARKAWYIAGVFEYPIMAFTGVFLGMCARVLFPEADSEMALPMLIKDVLPIGVTGIVIAAYFSAIMSTADSCLMASSGNFTNDIIERYFLKNKKHRSMIRVSQFVTLIIGILAVTIAAQFQTVLNAILYAYAFMVSGLFIPTLGAYFWKRGNSAGALSGMIGGGTVTLLLLTGAVELPASLVPMSIDPDLYMLPAELASGLLFTGQAGDLLDPAAYGLLTSLLLFVSVSLLFPEKKQSPNKIRV